MALLPSIKILDFVTDEQLFFVPDAACGVVVIDQLASALIVEAGSVIGKPGGGSVAPGRTGLILI